MGASTSSQHQPMNHEQCYADPNAHTEYLMNHGRKTVVTGHLDGNVREIFDACLKHA